MHQNPHTALPDILSPKTQVTPRQPLCKTIPTRTPLPLPLTCNQAVLTAVSSAPPHSQNHPSYLHVQQHQALSYTPAMLQLRSSYLGTTHTIPAWLHRAAAEGALSSIPKLQQCFHMTAAANQQPCKARDSRPCKWSSEPGSLQLQDLYTVTFILQERQAPRHSPICEYLIAW